jgi:NTE family protein
VLRALERNGVPISSIAGVSAGSIVAAAYASGASIDAIEKVARSLRFKDVARWTVSRFGLAENLPVRSDAYPGLFLPVRYEGRYLVDGLVSMEVPASPLRSMGATHVISVALPAAEATDPRSVMCVVSRCFTILSARTQHEWRRHSSVVIEPDVSHVSWDSFASSSQLIEAGERAAETAVPSILKWLKKPVAAARPAKNPMTAEKSVA